jgi:hypothetical protein
LPGGGGGDGPTSPLHCPTMNMNIRHGSGTQYGVAWMATPAEGFEVSVSVLSWSYVRAKSGPHCGETGWALTASFVACARPVQC